MKNNNQGALWKKIAKSGVEYYSGKITIDNTEYRVSMFRNKKEKDTQPDFNIIINDFEEKPKEKVEDIYEMFGNENIEVSKDIKNDLAF